MYEEPSVHINDPQGDYEARTFKTRSDQRIHIYHKAAAGFAWQSYRGREMLDFGAQSELCPTAAQAVREAILSLRAPMLARLAELDGLELRLLAAPAEGVTP